MSEEKDLIVVGNLDIETVFTKDGVDPLLKQIKDEVAKFVPDISTKDGQKEIRSMANKIARSKTLLDDLGKELVSGWKAKSRVVDQARKKLWDELEALQKKVRKPLTELEEKEVARVQAHRKNIDAIKDIKNQPMSTIEQVNLFFEALDIVKDSDAFEEFKPLYEMAQKEVREFLSLKREALQKQEEQQKENLRLRQELEEKNRIDYERKIAEDAVKKAREEEERKTRDLILKAEREKSEAEYRQKRAEEEKALEEKRRIENEEKHKREIEQQKAIAEKQKEDALKRRVNTDILNHFVKIGISKYDSKKIIISMSLKEVPHVQINY